MHGPIGEGFRAPEISFRPLERNELGRLVSKGVPPEEVMTPEQHKNMTDQLDALLRSKDFVRIDETVPGARVRKLPSTDFEIVRGENGKPLTHDGAIVIRNKLSREMFAVTSKNLQAKPDGTIHYTPSNFAADPKGEQAANKSSAKPVDTGGFHKTAVTLNQKQEPSKVKPAIQTPPPPKPVEKPVSKAMQAQKNVRSQRESDVERPAQTQAEPVEFQTSTVAAMAAANMGKVFTDTQKMKTATETVEKESQQTGSIVAAVTAKQGTAQSNEQQGRKDQGQQNAEAFKTSEQIRKETTETVTSKTAAGGTPGRR